MSSIISTLISQVITKLNTGFNISNGGIEVGSSNPLPTQSTAGSAILTAALLYKNVFTAHGVTVPASSGNYSKLQLWNPANSGKIIIVYQCNLWQTSGSVIYKTSLAGDVLSENENVTTKQNIVAGSAKTSVAKIYTKNNDATSSTLVISQLSTSSTTSNGANVLNSTFQGIILPNTGLTIESTTLNMAINAWLTWAEVDLSDLPTI